jgi:hypothetical protein
MCVKKIEQILLYEEIKYNYYTLDELNEKIVERSKIIEEYNLQDIKSRLYRNINKIENENWKTCSERPGIRVSNLGRVEIDKKIWQQREVKNKIGYLIFDNYRNVPEKYKDYLSQFNYVYQLVARIWLGRHIEDGCIWDVHHITNKGFDNRPENLIWMKRCEHNMINHKTSI